MNQEVKVKKFKLTAMVGSICLVAACGGTDQVDIGTDWDSPNAMTEAVESKLEIGETLTLERLQSVERSLAAEDPDFAAMRSDLEPQKRTTAQDERDGVQKAGWTWQAYAMGSTSACGGYGIGPWPGIGIPCYSYGALNWSYNNYYSWSGPRCVYIRLVCR